MNPRIICAANRDSETGVIILGIRHWDKSMHQQANWMTRANDSDDFIFDEQGFVDQFGRFYDRQEAWKVAESNNQIIRRCGGDTANGGTLYSENLY